MKISIPGVLALTLLAGCGGNPLAPTPGGGGGSSGNSVSTLPGTNSPSASGNVVRYEDKNKGPDGTVTGNGFAFQDGQIHYNATGDTFTVDDLGFDGANVYQRDGTVSTLGPARVYTADTVVNDPVTGAPISQFTYKALYGTSTTGRTKFAIVRTGSYIPYGFGGFIYSRTGGVTLPTSGQAQYTGAYAGLRDFNGVGNLQYTTADVEIDIDFSDFNPNESGVDQASAVRGYVSNRQIFDLNGNNITAGVLADINNDLNPDVALTSLPTLVFAVGPGHLDTNGELDGTLNNSVVVGGVATEFETGHYYAVLSGANADEIAGIIVVTSDVAGVTARDTGGFILYRP